MTSASVLSGLHRVFGPAQTRFLVLGLLALWLPAAGAAPAQRAAAEWVFDQPGNLLGWQPNGHLAGVRVAAGALSCRATGADPILEFKAPLDITASPWQVIEVRMKASQDGECEFFWSRTAEGKYGGFSQDKTTRFAALGDNQWHTCRIFPFWHPEKRIVRLRFDLYGGAQFDIASIRIVELSMPEAAAATGWEFQGSARGWQGIGADLAPGPSALGVQASGPDSWLLGPPVQLAAEDNAYVSVRMSAAQGSHGTLLFATESTAGLKTFDFPILADGRDRACNIDLLAAQGWRGRVIALGLRPTDAPGARSQLRWVKAGPEPQGPPELAVRSFGLESVLPRAGKPAALSAVIANTGGETASSIRATLTLPKGVERTGPDAASGAERLAFGERATLTWQVRARAPLTNTALVTVTCGNAGAVTAAVSLAFTERPAAPAGGGMPEPRPVRGPYEVGAYYFPGWNTASQWQPLQAFPERRPALGWYREGEPEIADWHIKWAVEHGITFFAYDWYWSRGSRSLEHALHDGYFKARHRNLLKFCLLWANHNAPGSSSPEDCLAVTRHWIANYFNRPEHLTFEGKPVMIIFSPDRLEADLGADNVAAAFDTMRQECRAAGLKGLYLIACVGSAGQARQCARQGYDAVSAYNWPTLGASGKSLRAPYETLVEGYSRQWNHFIQDAALPLLIPVNGGWDSRPWHGENNWVRYGRTPELFQRHLTDARRLLDAQAASAKPAVLPMILVEAWNEWGEGSYIEPHQEFGFGYLDAVRNVFTPAAPAHSDLVPADVNLGPYDVPPSPPPATAWTFSKGLQGWDNVMDLSRPEIQNAALSAASTGRDPAFFGPQMRARAAAFGKITLRMRIEPRDGAAFQDSGQLFWRTDRWAESEDSSLRFAVRADGQWHDYSLPVGGNPRWRGVVTRLRLDPCNRPGARVQIERLELNAD